VKTNRPRRIAGHGGEATPEARGASVVAEAGEFVPTELNLSVVYIPGLSNRRNILVIDRQPNSSLSSR
jgi:hypothetical protein